MNHTAMEHRKRPSRRSVLDAPRAGARTGLALVLAVFGVAALLGVRPLHIAFAEAGWPDWARLVAGAVLLGNSALLLTDRLAFVGTIVPMGISLAWTVASVTAGNWLLAIGGVIVFVSLAAVAARRTPIPLVPRQWPRPASEPQPERFSSIHDHRPASHPS